MFPRKASTSMLEALVLSIFHDLHCQVNNPQCQFLPLKAIRKLDGEHLLDSPPIVLVPNVITAQQSQATSGTWTSAREKCAATQSARVTRASGFLPAEYHTSKVVNAVANLHSLFGQELIQIADDANIWWQSSRRGARTAGGEDIKLVKGCERKSLVHHHRWPRHSLGRMHYAHRLQPHSCMRGPLCTHI